MMKKDTRFIKHQSFTPLGFGWFTGSKASINSRVRLENKLNSTTNFQSVVVI